MSRYDPPRRSFPDQDSAGRRGSAESSGPSRSWDRQLSPTASSDRILHGYSESSKLYHDEPQQPGRRQPDYWDRSPPRAHPEISRPSTYRERHEEPDYLTRMGLRRLDPYAPIFDSRSYSSPAPSHEAPRHRYPAPAPGYGDRGSSRAPPSRGYFDDYIARDFDRSGYAREAAYAPNAPHGRSENSQWREDDRRHDLSPQSSLRNHSPATPLYANARPGPRGNGDGYNSERVLGMRLDGQRGNGARGPRALALSPHSNDSSGLPASEFEPNEAVAATSNAMANKKQNNRKRVGNKAAPVPARGTQPTKKGVSQHQHPAKKTDSGSKRQERCQSRRAKQASGPSRGGSFTRSSAKSAKTDAETRSRVPLRMNRAPGHGTDMHTRRTKRPPRSKNANSAKFEAILEAVNRGQGSIDALRAWQSELASEQTKTEEEQRQKYQEGMQAIESSIRVALDEHKKEQAADKAEIDKLLDIIRMLQPSPEDMGADESEYQQTPRAPAADRHASTFPEPLNVLAMKGPQPVFSVPSTIQPSRLGVHRNTVTQTAHASEPPTPSPFLGNGTLWPMLWHQYGPPRICLTIESAEEEVEEKDDAGIEGVLQLSEQQESKPSMPLEGDFISLFERLKLE